MYAFRRVSCPSFFQPSTNRRMYRLLSNGLIGDPCGVPRPFRRKFVLEKIRSPNPVSNCPSCDSYSQNASEYFYSSAVALTWLDKLTCPRPLVATQENRCESRQAA